jgi:hypothetical protein
VLALADQAESADACIVARQIERRSPGSLADTSGYYSISPNNSEGYACERRTSARLVLRGIASTPADFNGSVHGGLQERTVGHSPARISSSFRPKPSRHVRTELL